MKNVKLETLSTQDIQLKRGKIIELETKSGLKRSITRKRIRENIKRNINAIMNAIQEYYYSIKEIFLYYLYSFIYVLNNFTLAVAEKRNKNIIFIKENEIKNITRKDCNNMAVNKQKQYKIYNKEKRFIYIYIIIIFSLILPINNNTSNITLVVKGPGLKQVLSSYFDSNYYPNITIINGIENTIALINIIFLRKIILLN